MNLVLCDDGKNDKTIRVLASDGKLYDIADISKDLFDILVATRIREDLQVDGTITTAGIMSADTREVNSTPEEYMSNGRRTTTEFKQCSAIGFSGPETYCTLVTIVQWGDSSGGYPKQIAVSAGSMYIRTGISNTTWGNWSAVLIGGIPWSAISDKPSTFPPAAHTQAISQGGTGATSASAALSNLGAAPIANLKRVDLWQGTCNKGGSVTVTNAYRYSVLWLVVTPGSGESEIIACEYNNRAAVRQICSNNSWIGITSSISGNNKTFTVSGGNDGCKLTKIVGAVQFQ